MKKILAFICLLAFAGCYYDNEEELYPTPANTGGGSGCDTANMSFANDITPILNQKCATSGCHDKISRASNYDFTTYSSTMQAVNNNRLMGSIMYSSGFSPMPLGMDKLSDCNISKIKAWVNAGAPNN